MKVGILVPFSWSFWGAVTEYAELQAEALRRLGVETRTIIGNDPPGSFTRLLHPHPGRHDEPPADVIPVGRTVIVPANGSLATIVLSPPAVRRIRRALEPERFDVLHVHEPMTPAVSVAAVAQTRCAVVATWHPAGPLRWNRAALRFWGFLIQREILPNGVPIPPRADPDGREHCIVFAGGHDPRNGLQVLLRAWSSRVRFRLWRPTWRGIGAA